MGKMLPNAAFCCAALIGIQSFHPARDNQRRPRKTAMPEASFNPSPKEELTERRLDSWKEIAAYLNRDVTTVQRWEKREGMPVHRHLHDKRGSVYAFATELDRWTHSRKSLLPDGTDGEKNGDGSGTIAPTLPARSPSSRRWKFILPPIALASAVAGCVLVWMQRTDRFWHNPIASAQFQAVTDWGGREQAAAISRDGQFVAFLSDRDGQMDVWVTQVGSGQFHNLTHGSAAELENPSVRTLGFSPDGSLVTYWARKPGTSNGTDIGIWAVPTLGASRTRTWKGRLNMIGQTTANSLPITKPVRETRCLCPRATCNLRSGLSSLHLLAFTIISPFGHQTRNSSTL